MWHNQLYIPITNVLVYLLVNNTCRVTCIAITFNPVGALLSFGTVLFSLFWVLYTSHLVVKLSHPLRSIEIFNSDYSRAIYIVEVLIALFIATTPSVVGAGLSKYRIVSFPPAHCENYGAYRFYSFIVPVMIAVCVSVILMLLALYKIHVVSLTIIHSNELLIVGVASYRITHDSFE